jgi:hypothetical protein
MLDHLALTKNPLLSTAIVVVVLLAAYLVRLNHLLLRTPDEIKQLAPTRWTKDVLTETYTRLGSRPMTTASCGKRIPPKLERRYIVTGGSGELTLRHLSP